MTADLAQCLPYWGSNGRLPPALGNPVRAPASARGSGRAPRLPVDGLAVLNDEA
jgi:hypothetical protein